QLTKQRGSLLTYDATAQFGLVGPVAADVKLEGRVSTRLPVTRDSLRVTAYGSFANTAAPYITEHYVSNHFIWSNNFGKERHYRLGGIVDVPLTHTQVNVGIENIQNLIYFNDQSLPAQYGDNIQVFSAQLYQRLKYRALHWDNRITFQTTSQADVLPLPKLAWYSNLYVTFKVAHVLDVQLGMDCDYYTRYKGYAYQPATMTFHTQQEAEVGNYPFMNLYLNFKLSKTRFYLMMSHFNQGIIGGDNYFSMPNYPLNPRRFQLGLSVDFAN
ncbi:MAG: putative porin, partial [Muribaculaceae bacterium]|nr:putative porin [Muribaculaceae bacterium]